MRHKVFAGLLTLFMLSFFFIAEQHQRNWLLYLTALSAHSFVLDASAWRGAFVDGAGLALMILIGFPLLSLAWSDGIEPHGVRSLFVAGYCIFTIYIGMVQLVDARPRDLERLKNVLLAAAVFSSALSLGNWLLSDQAGVWRLQGVLGLNNPVHASILLLAATLPAVRRMTLDRAGLGWLAACILPWLFVVLAGARAAMGAYLIIVVLLLTGRRDLRGNVMVGICAVVVIASALALAGFDGFRDIWLARGVSYRNVIWAQVWAQFRDCDPIIGCGIGSPLSITLGAQDSSRPHSIFLGALYYQGVLGLLAFFTALGYLMFRALREAGSGVIDHRDWAVMLGFALLANLTSGDHIMVRATLFWSYFWLPVMVIASLRFASNTSSTATGRGNSR